MTTPNKTALILGGGGARGAYEIGVWQALREMEIKLDLVAGSSVGAINGAMIAQDAFELSVSLWKQIETGMVFDLSLSLTRNAEPPLRKLLEEYVDEARVRSSSLEYGLVTLELNALAPRYLFIEDIPTGKLIDFIIASSSIFPALPPREIDKVKYVDGGYTDNVPVEMARMKQATHVVAVDLEVAGITRKSSFKQTENLTLIRPNADLGNMLIFRGDNAARSIRLGYLDTLKAFGFFSGDFYCFSKTTYKKKDLAALEAAGKIFGLDPGVLFTPESFERHLAESVEAYSVEIRKELIEAKAHIKSKRISLDGVFSLLSKANERTLTLVLSDFLADSPAFSRAMPLSPLLPSRLKDCFIAASFLLDKNILRPGS